MKQLIKAAIVHSSEPIIIFTNHLEHGLVEPKIVYANAHFEKLSGYNLSELSNRNPCEFLGKETKDKVRDIVSVITKKDPWQGPVSIKTKDGSEVIAYIKLVSIVNPVDEILYYACFVQSFEQVCHPDGTCDLLENFVESLFEHYNYYQDVSDQIPQALVRFDLEGKILYANTETQRTFNMFINNNIFDYVDRDDRLFVRKMIRKNLPNDKISKITFKLNTGNKITWVACSFWPIIKNNEVVGFAGNLQDVSKETNLVRQLEILKKA